MAQIIGVSDDVNIELASLHSTFFICTYLFVLAQPQKFGTSTSSKAVG